MKPCPKKSYHNRRDANRFKRNVKRRYGAASTVYFCDECRAYHLTSVSRDINRSLNRKRMAGNGQGKKEESLSGPSLIDVGNAAEG